MTQECFLALLRNATRYEPRATFRSYLYGIATNLAFAELRKSAREVRSNGPVDGIVQDSFGEAAIWVRRALERLESADREILMLREYEQLSYAEIGSLMRLPLNTVRSRLFRARMALKDQLMPAKEHEGGAQ